MEEDIIKEKKMYKIIKIADLFTLANLTCGLLAIIFFINDELLVGSIMILAAVIFDFLDGKVARLLKKQNAFGKELDSLCDLISFGIAPAILIFTWSDLMAYIPLYIAFVCTGALRLARFNITKIKGFIGMPITVNGILFPILYFISTPLWIVYIIMAIASYLMISSIRFRKI